MSSPFLNPDWYALTAGNAPIPVLLDWLLDHGHDEFVEWMRNQRPHLPSPYQIREWYFSVINQNPCFDAWEMASGIYSVATFAAYRISNRTYKGNISFHFNTDGMIRLIYVQRFSMWKMLAHILPCFGRQVQIEVGNLHTILKNDFNINGYSAWIERSELSQFESFLNQSRENLIGKIISPASPDRVYVWRYIDSRNNWRVPARKAANALLTEISHLAYQDRISTSNVPAGEPANLFSEL